MKPTSSEGRAAPALRSTTVLRSPATSGTGATKSSFDSIRLNTYHDSSDLKAALRKLEAAFAEPVGAANPPASSSSVSQTAFGRSSTEASARNSEADYLPRRAPASTSPSPRITVISRSDNAGAATNASSSSPPSLPARKKRSGPSLLLLQLPSQLLLRCFSFCDLKMLGVLCCVSVRLNVLVAQQGSELWAAAARRRRIEVSNPSAPRAELRRALEERSHARHAEEEFYEGEIARMEERLRARAADVYAQNVNVNQTIASGGMSSARAGAHGGGGSGGPASPEPYWMRQQRLADAAHSDGEKTSTVEQLCAKLRTEIEALEETKRLCECRLALHEESLQQQNEQLQQWQLLLVPDRTPVAASTTDGVAVRPTQKATPPIISAAQLDGFERRIARLVLCGSTPSTAAGDGSDIPLVFRRGVEGFAALELVLGAVGAYSTASGTTAGASKESGDDDATEQGSMAGKETARASSAAARECGKRWRAFQQVCPVNEEYANVRSYLRASELQTALSMGMGGNGQRGGDGSGGGSRPSAKQTPALLRVSGFVRRVEGMTDAQVVQAWM